jgi:hypothetical protein
VPLEELPVPTELVAVLLGAEVPVGELPLLGVVVVVVGADPALVGTVLAAVDDGVPLPVPVAPGSVTLLPVVPSALGAPAGVESTGVAVGSVGSSVLGELPGG